MTLDPGYGSHIPVLVKLASMTSGPVLEMGMGLFSTPLLHWLCLPTKRKLVSYENSKEYIDSYSLFKSDFHSIISVESWSDTNLSGYWDIALIDHAPAERRKEDALRLRSNCGYVVLHDSQREVERRYHYSTVYPFFKYRKEFGYAKPHVTVLSNFNDVTKLTI